MFGTWEGDNKNNTNVSGAPQRLVVDGVCTCGVVKGLCSECIDGGACQTHGCSSSVQ